MSVLSSVLNDLGNIPELTLTWLWNPRYITCLGTYIFTVQWNMGWDSPSSTMIVFLLLIEIAPIEDKSYKFWALKISPLKHSFIQVAKRLGHKQ